MAQPQAAPQPATRNSPPTPDTTQERIADFVHGATMQNIVLADRKAGILFTLVSAALLFLFTRTPAAFDRPVPVLWLIVVACLVVAAACAFVVIFPRLRRGSGDLLFWGDIARYDSADGYMAAVCRRDASTLARGKLTYCHDLACICARKFRLLRIAMIFAATGLVMFLVLLALGLPVPNAGRPPVV